MASSLRLRFLVAVFFMSASMLAFEVLTIRFISILFTSLATYLVISLAMLGYGISGGLLTFRKSEKPFSTNLLAIGSVFYSLAILVALGIIWNASKSDWLGSWVLIIALTVPFALGGFVMSIALGFKNLPLNRIYFADLIGAGLGAGIVAIGLRFINGPQLLICMAAFGFLSSALFAGKGRLGIMALTSSIGVAFFVLAVPLPNGVIPISPKELALVSKQNSDFIWDYQGWDPVARIDVVSLPGKSPEAPEGLNYKLVLQDGGAPSALFKFTSESAKEWFIQQTIFGIPYWIKQNPKVLVIGLGGGPDVQAALLAGSSKVVGLEINEKMIRIAQREFADFNGNPYADPRVNIVQGDGRNYIHLSSDKFDVIQLTGVDTSVASLGGNPNLGENFLYTVEAFQEFYKHLENGGVLSVSFPNVEGLGLRLVAMSTDALANSGVEYPEKQLVVSQIRGYIHVLIKKGAFTDSELKVLFAHFDKPVTSFYFPLYHHLFGNPTADFIAESRILAAPGLNRTGDIGKFFNAYEQEDTQSFLASQTRNVLPPTDNQPFFFVLDKWGYRANTLQVLVLALSLLGIAALLLILLPPLVQNRRGLHLPGTPILALYFYFLGLGYLLVEVNLIQRLALFLGHPSYAIAVTLLTLLIASGIGSLLSEKWDMPQATKIKLAGLLVAFLIVLEAQYFATVEAVFGNLSLILRTVISIILIALPGFFMGIPFPTGMTVVRENRPIFVQWAWAINATASVIATPLSLIFAITWGFKFTFIFSALLYLSAALAFAGYERLWLKKDQSYTVRVLSEV